MKVESSPSLFFKSMEGSVHSVAAAHGEGEGRVELQGDAPLRVAGRLVYNTGAATEHYPLTPNGSKDVTVTTPDGQVTILMRRSG